MKKIGFLLIAITTLMFVSSYLTTANLSENKALVSPRLKENLAMFSKAITTAWTTNGIVIKPNGSYQENALITSDGAGGAIIAWDDTPVAFSDIIAQRINSSGDIQWSESGVTICNADDIQTLSQIISDGAGGAIIAWNDFRSNQKVFVQKVNSSGHIQWAVNGTQLCTQGTIQFDPHLCSDGVGGAIIAWYDNRVAINNYNIYVQRIDSNGNALWTIDGVIICGATGHQQDPRICSDGEGGAIITWRDARDGSSNYQIYAQRIDANGATVWASNGIPICREDNSQYAPEICNDGTGGAIITWYDARGVNWDIYAQRVNSYGEALWKGNGTVVCSEIGDQSEPELCNDGTGGAIITWIDARSLKNIYAQKIDMNGIVQWTPNGTAMCSASSDKGNPKICGDEVGGALITWMSSDGGTYDIYAQHVNSGGNLLWSLNGEAICTESGHDQKDPAIISDGNGGAILAWEDYRGTNWDIYAQRIRMTGTQKYAWKKDGEGISTLTDNQWKSKICTDGAGGAIIAWEDRRNGNNMDVYAQRILPDGSMAWTVGGVAICTNNSIQEEVDICSDGSGGAIITWEDRRNGGTYPNDIYAQRINSSGVAQWTTDGIPICTIAGDQLRPTIISDGTGGAIITWEDQRYSSLYDIFIQKINASGAVQWNGNGVAICTAANNSYEIQLCSDGAGGAIITWEDNRGVNYDIYAQSINSSADIQWGNNGTAICTADNSQWYPEICSDGAGGAIITWQDARPGSNDIYAQRINSSGGSLWGGNGSAVCTAGNSQSSPRICTDGTGGAIIAWYDFRSGISYDIYTQRVNSEGNAQWLAGGIAICTATDNQYYPKVISDGAGGAIITWDDLRTGTDYDIYAQRISSIGTVQWTTNGIIVSEISISPDAQQICSDGIGGVIITWYDSRTGDNNIYAQRITYVQAAGKGADSLGLLALLFTGEEGSGTTIAIGVIAITAAVVAVLIVLKKKQKI